MFHVFVRIKGSEKDRPLLLDLSESELRSKFVDPYLDGKDIFDNGSITRITDISKVTVLSSELTSAETLRKIATDHQAEIDRIRREEGQNVMGSYRGRETAELIEYCKNVTSERIVRAPGTGTRKTKFLKLLHNPWIVRVGGGGLLLIIGVLIGKLWGS